MPRALKLFPQRSSSQLLLRPRRVHSMSKEIVDPLQLPTVGKSGLASRVSIWKGDITTLKADMIVNAANESLLGGGGVDGAIHRAAGGDLLTECKTLGGAKTGETKVTKGYDLPAKYVAHTVGPVYKAVDKIYCAEKLADCYSSSLEALVKVGGKTIGFPSVSTGVYGYPIVDATDIALTQVAKFLRADKSIERVVFVVFSEKDEEVYHDLVEGHLVDN